MSLPYVHPELQALSVRNEDYNARSSERLSDDDGALRLTNRIPSIAGPAKDKSKNKSHAEARPVFNGRQNRRSGDRSQPATDIIGPGDARGVIKIKDRSSTIIPELIGYSFAVYNGKEYKTFGKITPNHVGRKFGEFSPTKKPAIYKKKK